MPFLDSRLSHYTQIWLCPHNAARSQFTLDFSFVPPLEQTEQKEAVRVTVATVKISTTPHCLAIIIIPQPANAHTNTLGIYRDMAGRRDGSVPSGPCVGVQNLPT